MYNNKKIVPIFSIDELSPKFETLSQSMSELITIPANCETVSDFEDYLLDNNVQTAVSNGYRRGSGTLTLRQSTLADFNQRAVSTLPPQISIFFTYNSVNQFRYPNSIAGKAKFHLALSHLEYNWDVHEKIISDHNFYPLIVNSHSGFHTYLYDNLLSIPGDGTIPENFTVYPSDQVLFLLWKDLPYSYSAVQDDPTSQKVHSSFSPGIFYSLKDSILNLNANSNSYENQNFQFERPESTYLARNREYYSHRNALKSMFSKFTFGLGHDFHFFKHTTQESIYNSLIDNHLKKKLTVIKVPSWKSKSKDSKIELTTYTKNQCKTRKAAFMGLVNHHQVLLSKTTQQEINLFCLATSVAFQDVATHSRSLKKFVELFTMLTWNEGVKIYDPDEANLILEQMYAGLNKYSNYCCERVSEENLNTLLNTDLPEYSPLNSNQASCIAASPRVSLSIKNKYKKLSSLFNKNLETISPRSLQSTAESMQESFNNIYSYQRLYERAKEATSMLIGELTDIIGNIYNAASFIAQNKSIHAEIKNRYFEEYQKSLNEKNYDVDDFFLNMSNDGIKIDNISYHFEGEPYADKTLSSFSSKDDFIRFIDAKNSDSRFKYSQVTFLINKPVHIRIDNKDNYVVGGPYLVKCTQSSIRICLSESASLYGHQNGNFAIHPHTTSYSNPASLFNYANGCLGEAASLLYHAFEKNDLKLIVLSAMTWVTSANSSDPWGRKYDWFTPLSNLKDFDQEALAETEASSEIITEQEIDNFLISVCEEEEQEETQAAPQEETHEQNQLANPQDGWRPQDFTTPPENYTPVFANLNNS